jgi:hypothetical protein
MNNPVIKKWYTARVLEDVLDELDYLDYFGGINEDVFRLYCQCRSYVNRNSCSGRESYGHLEKLLLSHSSFNKIFDIDFESDITDLLNYGYGLVTLKSIDENKKGTHGLKEGIIDYLKLKGKDFDSKEEEEVLEETEEEMTVS